MALIPYFRRDSPALTDDSCKDYRCPRGYEHKDDYEEIACKYDCDDDDCCKKGGFGSAMLPNSDVSSRSMDVLPARNRPHAQRYVA